MILKVLVIILIAYVVLIFAPCVVIYLTVFKYVPEDKLFKINPDNDCYSLYKEGFKEALAWIKQLPFQEAEITSDDNLKLKGNYVDGGFKKVIIFMHGYHGQAIDPFCVQAKDFYERGFNLLFPIERAHGKSEGKFITLGLKEKDDLLSWLSFMDDKTEEMVVYGASMGSAAVGFASSEITNEKVKALVLDCGFTSPYNQMIYDGKKRHLPWPLMVPIESLCGKIFAHVDMKKSVTESLRKNKIPTFFIHGKKDRVVLYTEGVTNYENNLSAKEIILSDNSPHMYGYLENHEENKKKLLSFIDKCLDS